MSVDIGSYIVRTPGTVGGRPRIDGTRVTVRSVAVGYKQGLMPEEIVQQYEHLTIAQVYAALTYYHANRDEIEADIKAENDFGVTKVQPASRTMQADGGKLRVKLAPHSYTMIKVKLA